MNKSEQHVWATAEASESTIQHLAHRLLIRRERVSQSLFDVSVTEFFRVDFGRIRRQRFYDDLRMRFQIGLGFAAGVNSGSIPDQDEPSRQVSPQMLKGYRHLFALHSALKVSLENPARQGQTDCRRKRPALTGHPAQHRTVSHGSPGRAERLQKGKAEFIEEHDFCAVSPRLFLSAASRAPARRAPALRPVPPRGVVVAAGSTPTGATAD